MNKKSKIVSNSPEYWKQFQQLIQDLPTAIYTTDDRGIIQVFNNAAVELWGMVPDSGRDSWCNSLKLYNMDGSACVPQKTPMGILIEEKVPMNYKVELLLERVDGSIRCITPNSSPIFDITGKFIGTINILDDLTVQKSYVQTIESQKKKLNDIAWIQSHKVRGPVARILGLLNLLENTDGSEREILQFIKLLKNEGNELDKSIRDIVSNSNPVNLNIGDVHINSELLELRATKKPSKVI